MSVRTENLGYYVNSKFGTKKICLLDSVSLSIPRSSVTAIMGPSGAGKTTLMNLLCGTADSGFYSGDVFIDETLATSRLKTAVAHVECFDFHIEEFTVLQNLYFAAMLRVGKHMGHSECVTCCIEIARIVHLQHVLGVTVGSDLHKGISGGQKKLLSIAIELLSFPTILCMDEPTSGLDAATSIELSKVLTELAKNHNKTIICTVHQPSAAMLESWQHLVLVGSGAVVYEGPIAECASYLTSVGYVLSSVHSVNPVEYFVELLSDNQHTDDLKLSWKKTSLQRMQSPRVSEPVESGAGDVGACVLNLRDTIPLYRQILVLTQRHGLYTLLNLHGVRGMFARNILGGLFYGVLYYKNGQELWDLDLLVTPSREGLYLSPYVYNSVTVCFSVPLFIVFINLVPIPAMFAMKRYCDKEQGNELYTSIARWVSLILIDIPLLFLGTSCFIAITLPMSGFRQSWYHYGLIVMFASVCGYAQAQLCAHVSRSAIQGFILMAVFSCLQLLFSGYLITYSDLPDWLEWGVFASFMRWCTGQIMVNEFSNLLKYQGDIIIELWDYQHFKFWRSRDVLFLYFIGLELLILLALLIPKRKIQRMDSPENVRISCAEVINNPLAHSQQRCIERELDEEKEVEKEAFKQSDAYLEHDDVFKAATALPESRKVDFVFQNVSYTLESGKTLLFGIDGCVKSGELCALMGLSGSGKTTLLNVLAGKANAGVVTGSILTNGNPFSGMRVANSIANSSMPTFAYVMQEDAHFPLFTVKETLEYAAMLRRRTFRVDEVQDMVMETLKVLGLAHIADHFVGRVGKSMISRGQLRRLTVGVEIVNSPAMVFLDEPTTGLDSFLASTVVRGLRTLSQSGRTLLCTIHSPSPSIFSQFDKVLLLSEGHVLYFGPTYCCQRYLQDQGGFLDTRLYSANPADFIVAVALHLRDNSEQCPKHLSDYAKLARDYTVQSYPDDFKCYNTADDKNHVLATALDRRAAQLDTSSLQSTLQRMVGSIKADFHDVQKSPVILRVLLSREFLKEKRRYRFWLTVMLRAIVLGVIIGAVWGDQTTEVDILNIIGLFLTVFIAMNLWMVEIVPMLQEDKVIFYRERDSNATSTFASWLVTGFPTTLALAPVVFATTSSAYFMTSLRSGAYHYSVFFLAAYVTLVSNMHLGRFISTLTPNTMVNVLIFPPITMTIQAMLCGYSCMISTLPDWFRWLTNIDAAKWCMGIQFINQLQGNDSAILANYHSLLNDFGWNYPMRDQFSYIVYILIVNKCLTYLGMRYTSSARQ